ncbi:MAG TPA: archease [Chitinispirillaceae bacterium]|jgi:SHS2 domain-containing protein|nr:archease [Chitinispirillaceae bacterium]
MPYEYLEDITVSDAGFRAWGKTLEELFTAAFDATTNLMVEDLGSIGEKQVRSVKVEDNSEEMLLFQVLQELIYLKDAFRLLLRLRNVSIERHGESIVFEGMAVGEEIDDARHNLAVDVKAVTLHHFQVMKTDSGWEAVVVLDV